MAAAIVEAVDGSDEHVAHPWNAGLLRDHVDRVLAFVERNRYAILRVAGPARDHEKLLAITKRLIVSAGAVHAPSEMRDQVREIQDEIWIRGERGDYDHVNIAHEWTSLHASNWRAWRVKEYLFVADRAANDIVATLGA